MTQATEYPKKIGPWQMLDSDTRYENPWIRITHENVITPGGSKGIYGRIHFKNRAIAIVPIDDEGNTWLIGQHRYALDQYSWEVPMGGCVRGREPLDAAKAELHEEAGLAADSWQMIQTLHTSNSVTDETGFVFVARGLKEIGAQPEDTELLTIKKLPLKEAVEMVMDGTITDAISVAALLKVWLMLKA